MVVYLKTTKKILLAAGVFVATPATAFAVTAPTNLKTFAELAVKILQNIAGLLFVSLSIGLLFGVVLYLFSTPSEKRRSEIREMLLWGVIGIIVVVGIWGILALLRASVGLEGVGIPQISPPS
ncbi:MAG: hypothetical protein A3D65_05710 [Candidatus Lloydbacteria bacterium RIFCSPHIGHO2_02_FULL_50_13]|uniref:TrbC/VIRB2 family protein n=1 Tax=Candidatus Lloydbacteria bacterium RIFCSPHIGHO2_02_FULL_50_13 TaxID=1798661 RepID=A0A1G2D2B4_9BACT|nr:MAG: hypothetical protein A3D65_05710 [Candidatus Lloydbacteria bacterium RIFCSPHIGHO2_02_FULL_50_13]